MDAVIDAHRQEYGEAPDVMACAPGRFHLMGEHTWFFRDKTLSMAVNLPVYVAVSRRQDAAVRFYFVQLGERKRATMQTLRLKKEDRWANAIKAVLYGFTSGGFDCGGMNITVYSEEHPYAGFGITTAMKVASAWAVKELMRFRCTERQMLQVLERGDKLFLQGECYKADIFAAIYSKRGSVVLTDHAQGTYDVIPLPFKGWTILLTDARVPRITTWNEATLHQPENVLLLGELKERRANVYGGWHYEEDKGEVNEVLSVVGEDTRRRLICVMGEHRSVIDAESALRRNDFSAFARAVNGSQRNMRDLYDISCPEVDWLLKRVRELDVTPDDLRNPVNCGRITGKGYGRCTYSFIQNADVAKYKERLVEYERIFGFAASCHEVKPAPGVKLL